MLHRTRPQHVVPPAFVRSQSISSPPPGSSGHQNNPHVEEPSQQLGRSVEVDNVIHQLQDVRAGEDADGGPVAAMSNVFDELSFFHKHPPPEKATLKQKEDMYRMLLKMEEGFAQGRQSRLKYLIMGVEIERATGGGGE